MQLTAEGDAIRVRAPAKVNLVLEVLGKRPDGYHELDMANVTVSLYDELRIARSDQPGVTCTVDRPGLPTDEGNLAVRAALAVLDGRDLGVHIGIRKRIPAGAGLAGGSSDAAATLVAVDRLLGLATPPDRLAAMAGALGSDIPYLLVGGGARCTGRGELVEPHPIPVGLPLVIAWPRVELSTAAVYGALEVPLTPFKDRASVLFALLNEQRGWEPVADLLWNRLEEPARRLCPEVGATIDAMQNLGCQGVLMTGSGSAVVGLSATPQAAEQVAETMRTQHACDSYTATLVAN